MRILIYGAKHVGLHQKKGIREYRKIQVMSMTFLRAILNKPQDMIWISKF